MVLTRASVICERRLWIAQRNYTTTKTKIIVQRPVVEIGGDDMSKIVFDKIKHKLIIPFLNLERDYYDCSLTNRHKTGNEVVREATSAILKYNVGIKCATRAHDEEKCDHANTWMRNALNGTQIRESIICSNVNKFVNRWTKPIIICRHTFATDISFDKPSSTFDEELHEKDIALRMFKHYDSIKNFAEVCFQTALERKFPLVLSSKYYDSMFCDVFQNLYESKYKRHFDKTNLTYEHHLIDGTIGTEAIIKPYGGFVWAVKSYDVAVIGQGSMAMMMIKSQDGKTILTEPAHGSITRHYKRHLKGKQTSTNPISTIFAWTRGLQHRARLDRNYDLLEFTELLEQCALQTVEEGHLTKDLAACVKGTSITENDFRSTNEFINVIAGKLERNIGKIFPREVAQTA